MSPKGAISVTRSYVLKLTHKHLTEKKSAIYQHWNARNLPSSNIIETSEECIHVHQRHQDIMKPAMIAGRGGEGKNQKNKAKIFNPTKLRRKLSTYLSS
jgi:hypothetical protein